MVDREPSPSRPGWVSSPSSASSPSWASEWDPHPLCWLGGILRNRYGHHPGFRYADDGNLLLSVGSDGLEVTLAPRPDDPGHLHDVRTQGHGERVFGSLLWIELARLRRNADATAFVLGNGTELTVREIRDNVHVLRSADGYLMHANRMVADLPALVHVARMIDWSVRENRDLDDDPGYWRRDGNAPFAVLLWVLEELRRPETAGDLSSRLIQAPQRADPADDRLRQFKPQLRQAVCNPGLLPEKAIRQAAGSALDHAARDNPVLDNAARDNAEPGETDPHRWLTELWRRLYPHEAIP